MIKPLTSGLCPVEWRQANERDFDRQWNSALIAFELSILYVEQINQLQESSFQRISTAP
ncbi:MAG: hypothetical protein ACI9R3_001026 [Verrucomicrobiales bacterium]|jgi:hypothetical protein